MIRFEQIYKTACLHYSEDYVLSRLPEVKTQSELKSMPDDLYLSQMMRRIFRAGLKHKMVDAKWPHFERVFEGFDPFFCSMISDDEYDRFMSDAGLIRHLGKLKAIRTNATMVRHIAREQGSFAAYVSEWPVTDIVGLWIALKKQGAQLGGASAGYFLRMVGKDTFLCTQDVSNFLISQGVVEKAPTSQKDLKRVQSAFNVWHAESGRSMAAISRVASMAVMRS